MPLLGAASLYRSFTKHPMSWKEITLAYLAVLVEGIVALANAGWIVDRVQQYSISFVNAQQLWEVYMEIDQFCSLQQTGIWENTFESKACFLGDRPVFNVFWNNQSLTRIRSVNFLQEVPLVPCPQELDEICFLVLGSLWLTTKFFHAINLAAHNTQDQIHNQIDKSSFTLVYTYRMATQTSNCKSPLMDTTHGVQSYRTPPTAANISSRSPSSCRGS